MQLWIVGKFARALEGSLVAAWEFGGVFDSEAKAMAACRDASYCVAPVDLNAVPPHEPHEWAGAYYPHVTGGRS